MDNAYGIVQAALWSDDQEISQGAHFLVQYADDAVSDWDVSNQKDSPVIDTMRSIAQLAVD